jgi:hypothetical protein
LTVTASICSFGAVGKQLGNPPPKEVATDREGNVYVADAAFGNFQIFNPDGELLMFVGERSSRKVRQICCPPHRRMRTGASTCHQWFRKIDVSVPMP